MTDKAIPVINVIDDDPAVSQAIAVVAKAKGFRVSLYRNAEEFLYGHDHTAPGCLLLDIKMPGMNGLELQRMLIDAGIAFPIIMMSGHADIAMAVQAMTQGAITFLEKPFRMNLLIQKVEEAILLDKTQRVKRAQANQARELLAQLTDKEQEVLRQIMAGKTNKMIAEELKLSVRAIEDRRARVMKKLNATSLLDIIELIRLVPEFDSTN